MKTPQTTTCTGIFSCLVGYALLHLPELHRGYIARRSCLPFVFLLFCILCLPTRPVSFSSHPFCPTLPCPVLPCLALVLVLDLTLCLTLPCPVPPYPASGPPPALLILV
ncbi:unnamed protein product, partial [Discosporangium mesarthrocarpum]